MNIGNLSSPTTNKNHFVPPFQDKNILVKIEKAIFVRLLWKCVYHLVFYQLEKNANPLKYHDKVLVVSIKYRNFILK